MSKKPKQDGPVFAHNEDFQGPPMVSEFSDWKPEQIKAADGLLQKLDGIQLYRAAGGAGVGHEYAQESEKLGAQGISKENATRMARYRMWRENYPVPQGERAPDDSKEQIDARRDAFLKAAPEERSKLFKEAKQKTVESKQGFYDKLVGEPPKPKEQPPQAPMSQIGPEQAPGSLTPEEKAKWAEHANKVKGAV